MCDHQSLRSACAYPQLDQSHCKSLEYSMTVKLMTEHHFKGGPTGPYECKLVSMSHCWKSHAAAQLFPIFQVLLANRLDGDNHFKYTAITVPLFISLITLVGLSFGAKGGNHCKLANIHNYIVFRFIKIVSL